jgi:hypothetical protein
MNNFYNLQFLVSLDKCIKLVVPNIYPKFQKLLMLCLEHYECGFFSVTNNFSIYGCHFLILRPKSELPKSDIYAFLGHFCCGLKKVKRKP